MKSPKTAALVQELARLEIELDDWRSDTTFDVQARREGIAEVKARIVEIRKRLREAGVPSRGE